MGLSKNWGSLFGSPANKDHSIFESNLGPPVYGNPHMFQPCIAFQPCIEGKCTRCGQSDKMMSQQDRQ